MTMSKPKNILEEEKRDDNSVVDNDVYDVIIQLNTSGDLLVSEQILQEMDGGNVSFQLFL